jgi:hypothetical protein
MAQAVFGTMLLLKGGGLSWWHTLCHKTEQIDRQVDDHYVTKKKYRMTRWSTDWRMKKGAHRAPTAAFYSGSLECRPVWCKRELKQSQSIFYESVSSRYDGLTGGNRFPPWQISGSHGFTNNLWGGDIFFPFDRQICDRTDRKFSKEFLVIPSHSSLCSAPGVC